MTIKGILQCIDIALTSWAYSRIYSNELSHLASELRVYLARSPSSKTSDRDLAYIMTLYKWVADSTIHIGELTPAVLRAAKGLNIYNLFKRYVLTLKYIDFDAVSDSGSILSDDDTDSVSDTDVILPAAKPVCIPSNYNGIKEKISYFTSHIRFAQNPSDRRTYLFKYLEYIIDKEDFMAYEYECRSKINSFIELVESDNSYPHSIQDKFKLVFLRISLDKVLNTIDKNTYYRSIPL
jgi:hypothetical protein